MNPGHKAAEEKFKAVNEAYEVLSDAGKRKRYDQYGANWKNGADHAPPPGWDAGRGESTDFSEAFSGGGQNGFGDLFENLFRSRCGVRAGAAFRMRGNDVEAEIPLTLEEAYRGVKRSFTLQMNEPCPDCKGTGERDGKVCPKRRGTGVIPRSKSLEVTIPPGVRDGSIVRLAGQGEPGMNGGPPGDVLLHVRIEPHLVFETIDGNNVQVELQTAPWEAALGTTVHVPTLDGPTST